MRKTKKAFSLLLAAIFACGMVGCNNSDVATEAADATEVKDVLSQEEQELEEQTHKIGVAIYSEDDDEVQMFREYYTNYITAAFPVEFYYSSAIVNLDDEKTFVDRAKEAGCEGIISFVTNDLSDIVSYCGDDLYYMLGSGSVTEAEFQEASAYDNFLGIMGPSTENEKEAGANMIRHFLEDGDTTKNIVILSGGGAYHNTMHQMRTEAMLQTLESEYGYTLSCTSEEAAMADANLQVATSPEGGNVYVCPGYLMIDDSNLTSLLSEVDPDVVASVYTVSDVMDPILAKEEDAGKNISVGTVDCYCYMNQELFNNKDSFGNSQLDYLVGKCAAMSAPAFVAMFNAVSGHKELASDNGEAFWLNQNFWTATSTEEYEENAARATNIFDNVYATPDMMNILGEFNAEASFENFEAFVDAL